MGNIMPGTGKIGSGNHVGRVKYARANYDFAVDGGAIGTITLRGDALPSGAILLDAFVDVTTAFLPVTTTTVALTVQSAGDLRAAALTNASPSVISTTGAKRLLVDAGDADLVKTTAARSVTMAVAAGAVTAGKCSVVVAYLELA
ncbi:hypothetical protein DMA15_03540 [Streptomyces sp. WAC 01529]|uniref:hypothetical protein n=1 Tax=Streptomyces sp. WAC 01529 TaxID=2203205 RepID=UPI000F6DDE17|nr:hypothetical protein [Streptomyces sp. WAC 01529]AZM51766.1 hypothetical protein DMA15_03540 [Streptomyces sp. WAC 01529]